MSFKREGDDYSILRHLREQRVAELLADHIPEDEASLLKNGRYTCLVCHHRPIFDTVTVLSQHRSGKKHSFYLSKFLSKKHELDLLIEKRRHEMYMKTGKTDIPIAKSTESNSSDVQSSLLKTSQNSSTKISRSTPYSRKQTIAFNLKEDVLTTKKPQEAASQVKNYLKHTSRKRDFTEAVNEQKKLKYGIKDSTNNTSLETIGAEEKKLTKKLHSDKVTDAVEPSSSESQANKERAAYYLNLRASGWKKDLMGNWVKDEEAEFDSDEESPTDL